MVKKWIKLGDLPKKDRIFRIVNLGFMTLQFLACVGLAIYYYCISDPNNRLLTSIGMAIVMVLPLLLELIFKRRLTNILFLFYQVYALIAGLIGSVLNVYYMVGWYDIFVHCLAGYIFALAGIFVVSRVQDYKKLNKWLVLLFAFCFTMTCELVWELGEWFSDLFLNQTAQGIPIEGQTAPLVTDTMLDIFCNFSGGLVFALQFIIGKTTKCSLGINFLERELVLKRYDESLQKVNMSLNNVLAVSDNDEEVQKKE